MGGAKRIEPARSDSTVQPVVAEQAGGQERQERVGPRSTCTAAQEARPDRRPHGEPGEPPELGASPSLQDPGRRPRDRIGEVEILHLVVDREERG